MDKIWWEKLNSPSRFILDAADLLSSGKSVVLILPENLPWAKTMRNVFAGRLESNFSGTRTVHVVKAEKISGEPQEYVMKNFCGTKGGFRPFHEKAYPKFLAERTGIALNSSCLWIRNASKTQAEKWFAFIADYHSFLKGKSGGVFILEAGEDFFTKKLGVEILSYAQKISDYDSFAFNIFIAAEFGKENPLMKQYLAELVTQLTRGDVEFGAACIKQSETFLKNPAAVFENILCSGKFKSAKTPEDIDQAIWLTQLKLIFPLVENFRRKFIKQYENQIKDTPPFYSAPEEVEIGQLYGQFTNRRKFLNSADADDLEMYREVRNKLAHLTPLTFDDLQKIFEKNSQR